MGVKGDRSSSSAVLVFLPLLLGHAAPVAHRLFLLSGNGKGADPQTAATARGSI